MTDEWTRRHGALADGNTTVVTKRDGRVEPYDRRKIGAAMRKALAEVGDGAAEDAGALEALLAGSMSMQGLPVSLLTAYAGCLAAAVAALALERRLDRKLVGGMLLYPVFMACFLPLQTLALFKTQTIWHEIRHSGVRLAAEVDLRRGKIA